MLKYCSSINHRVIPLFLISMVSLFFNICFAVEYTELLQVGQALFTYPVTELNLENFESYFADYKKTRTNISNEEEQLLSSLSEHLEYLKKFQDSLKICHSTNLEVALKDLRYLNIYHECNQMKTTYAELDSLNDVSGAPIDRTKWATQNNFEQAIVVNEALIEQNKLYLEHAKFLQTHKQDETSFEIVKSIHDHFAKKQMQVENMQTQAINERFGTDYPLHPEVGFPTCYPKECRMNVLNLPDYHGDDIQLQLRYKGDSLSFSTAEEADQSTTNDLKVLEKILEDELPSEFQNGNYKPWFARLSLHDKLSSDGAIPVTKKTKGNSEITYAPGVYPVFDKAAYNDLLNLMKKEAESAIEYLEVYNEYYKELIKVIQTMPSGDGITKPLNNDLIEIYKESGKVVTSQMRSFPALALISFMSHPEKLKSLCLAYRRLDSEDQGKMIRNFVSDTVGAGLTIVGLSPQAMITKGGVKAGTKLFFKNLVDPRVPRNSLAMAGAGLGLGGLNAGLNIIESREVRERKGLEMLVNGSYHQDMFGSAYQLTKIDEEVSAEVQNLVLDILGSSVKILGATQSVKPFLPAADNSNEAKSSKNPALYSNETHFLCQHELIQCD